MFAVRIHGRGGQGAVTAAEMLSVAAFDEGWHAQAFPTFGSERTGAPVVAFCRISDRPIRLHEPVTDPDTLVIQDPTLLHQVDLFAGLRPDGYLGDPIVASPVTGAPFIDPATGQPANYFNVQRLDSVGQPGAIIGHTDQVGTARPSDLGDA